MALEDSLSDYLAGGDPSLSSFGLGDAAPWSWNPNPKRDPRVDLVQDRGDPSRREQSAASGGGGPKHVGVVNQWSRGATQGSLGKALWQQLADAGADPGIIGDVLAGTYGRGMMTDFNPDELRGAFQKPTSARDSLDYMLPHGDGGGGSPSRTTMASIQMPQAVNDPYWTGSAIRQRNDEQQRSRDAMSFANNQKLKMLQSIMGSLGMGGGGGNTKTTTEDSQQIVNNAGSWEQRPIHSVQTVNDPNQRLQLLSQILGGL